MKEQSTREYEMCDENDNLSQQLEWAEMQRAEFQSAEAILVQQLAESAAESTALRSILCTVAASLLDDSSNVEAHSSEALPEAEGCDTVTASRESEESLSSGIDTGQWKVP